MKAILLTVLFLSGLTMRADDFRLQNGDLIFLENCASGTDNTIKAVTAGIGDYRFTHVGIVYIDDNDSIYVIEATRPKVAKTPLNDYLYPGGKGCYPKAAVGRLKEEYRRRIPAALNEGLTLVGKDYDDGFILGNDKYYCSELIYEILLRANNGIPVFPLNTMTFKSPGTDEITEGWKEYFGKYNLPVPEGEPGINPGAMSSSDAIDVVHYY